MFPKLPSNMPFDDLKEFAEVMRGLGEMKAKAEHYENAYNQERDRNDALMRLLATFGKKEETEQ